MRGPEILDHFIEISSDTSGPNFTLYHAREYRQNGLAKRIITLGDEVNEFSRFYTSGRDGENIIGKGFNLEASYEQGNLTDYRLTVFPAVEEQSLKSITARLNTMRLKEARRRLSRILSLMPQVILTPGGLSMSLKREPDRPILWIKRGRGFTVDKRYKRPGTSAETYGVWQRDSRYMRRVDLVGSPVCFEFGQIDDGRVFPDRLVMFIAGVNFPITIFEDIERGVRKSIEREIDSSAIRSLIDPYLRVEELRQAR